MSNKFALLIYQLELAIHRLSEALGQPKNEFVRDSAIKRFEFTYELVWKTLKEYLKKNGIEAYFPREIIRTAFQYGLIEEDALWMKTVELRNLTSHTYHEPTADQVYETLPKILNLYKSLLEKLKKI
ncbi:MAG: HI0074 family nucleotidyltransferase substrate-binding subunit [Nitrospiria bacterium]